MKQYIIRKFVMAENAEEALEKAKKAKIDKVYVNPDYKEDTKEDKTGFKTD